MGPRSRAQWMKLRILLYSFDGESGTLFGVSDSKVGVSIPNPATPQDFLQWYYIEDADFDGMIMMAIGTAICHRWRSRVLFADQKALKTGYMLLCELHNNGQVRE